MLEIWAMCLDKPKKVAILDSVINDQQPALNGQIVAKYDVIKQQMFIIFTLTRMQRKL